ncbi:MAG: RDD family protein [Acidimicrobiia bacterium]
MQPQDPTDGANAWGAPTLPPGAPLPPPPPNWGAHTQGEAPQYYYGVPTVAGRVLAAPGARIGASLIDGVLLIVVFFVMMFSTIGSFTQFQTASAGQWRNFQIFAAILPVSYGFMNAVVLTYAVGGSIGKKITGLRVIKTDGDRVDFGAATIRWLLKYAGGPAGLIGLSNLDSTTRTAAATGSGGIVGIILLVILVISLVMLFSDDKNQTLNDKMARTIVVRDR